MALALGSTPVCFVVVGFIALIIVVGTIAIALLPIYLPNRSVDINTKDNFIIQRLVFIAANNSDVSDGKMSRDMMDEIQTEFQKNLKSSSVGALKTSKLTVLDAEVSTVNSTNKRKRDASKELAYRVENVGAHVGDKLVAVTCRIDFTGKAIFVLTKRFEQILRDILATVLIPQGVSTVSTTTTTTTTTSTTITTTTTTSTTITTTTTTTITMKTTKTTTTTTTTIQCVSNDEYFEEITGHTCQTYVDYGFCQNFEVSAEAPINAAQAQANCCECGKQP